jgi:hypothetical protein
MGKRHLLMNIFAMIIAILSLATFAACKEEEDIDMYGWVKSYPDKENYTPYEITNISGVIKYDETKTSYIFVPNDTKDIYPYELGFEGQGLVVLINDNDNPSKIQEHTGQCCIDGTIQFQYLTTPKGDNPFGIYRRYYSLKITIFKTISN